MKTTLYIDKMDCPTEEQLIRRRLTRLKGVQELEVDLVRRELTVDHSPESKSEVLAALSKLGMAFQPVSSRPFDEDSVARGSVRRSVVSRAEWIQLGVAGLLAIAAEIITLSGLAASFLPPLLSIVAIGLGGREMLAKGWRAVKAFTLGINFLMAIAVAGALLIGEWPEAAMVAVLFALAEKIEQYALDRSRGAIRSLMKLAPDSALVRTDSGDWKEVRAATVGVGERVRVRPGERVALDGVVVSGNSTVNQAPITGESMPVEKLTGDRVFAGSINVHGSLEFEVTRQKRDTTLARIIRTVQQAQSDRGKTQRFVDRFARYYTPSVVIVALLVAILPPLLVGGSVVTWLYRALVLLVIACPCALVISTPVTVVSGLAAAARRGILIKGGAYLESGHRLRVIALDKTGTLTEGTPRVTDIIPMSKGPSVNRVLEIAATLDAPSEHPIARALLAEAKKLLPDRRLAEVDQFRAVPGRGVEGHLDGKPYRIGNHRWAHESGLCSPEIESILESLEQDGKTTIVLSDDDAVLAVFGVADGIREATTSAIAELHALGLATVMLTGDNQLTAEAIGREAGIRDVRGGLLPEDKLAYVARLREEYGPVGMVGDGINDAPALAAADIGFAMGAAGTDTAVETAHVALMKDDLAKLATFWSLSRRTSRILWQNIGFAIVVKAVFLVLGIFGIATLWMAVFADMGASLLVTFNGLMLLRAR
jgi:Zn2+/Cd2+-exporting ATPase